MERAEIINILSNEGYPEFMLEKTADKIEGFSETVAVAYADFQSNGTVPAITIAGYDYNGLVNDYGMKPTGAFITLDWLIREPEIAKEALEKGIK